MKFIPPLGVELKPIAGIPYIQLITMFLSWLFQVVKVTAGALVFLVYRKPGRRVTSIQDPLLLSSATDLASKIRNQELTSEQVVRAFISRLREVNLVVNCVAEDRFEEAIEDARSLDTTLASGHQDLHELEREKPFLGIPVTIKNSIAVKNMLQTVGLYSRRHYRADNDAETVQKLKQAGAIIIATTNTSEMCLWWETYNNVHGRTNSPFDSTRTVGGSSGGEACAQTCGGSTLGLGSDIGGSLRIPAFFNGTFAHKPTNQVVSIEGHFPGKKLDIISKYLSIGPMSRHASDLRTLLRVIAKDEFVERLHLEKPVKLEKLKIFYMEEDLGSIGISKVEPDITAAVRDAVAYLRDTCGASVHHVNIRRMRYSVLVWLASMTVGRREELVSQELSQGHGISSWAEILKIFVGKSKFTLVPLVVSLLEKYGIHANDFTYTSDIIAKGQQLKADLMELLQDGSIFIYPTFPTTAPHHVQPISQPFDFAYAAIFNIFGFPVTQCPMGVNSKGLPIGIQIVASKYNDNICIAVAEELERQFHGWQRPGA